MPATFLLVAFLARSAAAAPPPPPSLDYLYPAGGQIGTALLVHAAGHLIPWPVQVWTDDPGLAFTAGPTNGEFKVQISPNAAVGPHLVRVFNADGASAPHLFVVGSDPEWVNEALSGTNLPLQSNLPFVFNSRLLTADAQDAVPVELVGSQRLHVEATALGLDSPLHPNVTVVGPNGDVLNLATGSASQETSLTTPASSPGAYRIIVSPGPGSLTGPEAIYRLRVWVDLLPLPAKLNAPVTSASGRRNRIATHVPMQVWSDYPATVHGFIARNGDEDRYQFDALFGYEYDFNAQVASLGTAWDARLRVQDEQGHTLATSAPAPNPVLSWVASGDGTYLLVIDEANEQGSPTWAYTLNIATPVPHFTTTVAGDPFRAAPGESVTVGFHVIWPQGYTNLVSLDTTGLPPGVSGSSILLTPGISDGDLKLTVADDASPTNTPFTLSLLPIPAVGAPTQATTPVPAKFTPPDQLLINHTTALWFTVLPSHP